MKLKNGTLITLNKYYGTLASAPPICKSAGYAEAARMPLVPRSNKFARQTCSPKYTRMYILDKDVRGYKQ